MDLTETGLILLATILMIATVVLSFIPILPGPVLAWAVASIFGAVEGFQRMTPVAVLVATLIMVVGATSDFWLRWFGIRTGGLSCRTTLGGFIGAMVGTAAIPIPVLGTLIGAVAGSALIELLRLGQMREAMRAGRVAAKMFVVGYVVQVVTTVAIFAVYAVSVVSTRPA